MWLKSYWKNTYCGKDTHFNNFVTFLPEVADGIYGRRSTVADNTQESNVLKDISWIEPGAPSPLIYSAGDELKVKCNWGARRVPLWAASVMISDVQQSSSTEGLSCTKRVPHAPSPLLWIIELAPSHPAEDLGMQKSENGIFWSVVRTRKERINERPVKLL